MSLRVCLITNVVEKWRYGIGVRVVADRERKQEERERGEEEIK